MSSALIDKRQKTWILLYSYYETTPVPVKVSAIVTEDTELRLAEQEYAVSRMSRYVVIAYTLTSIFCFVAYLEPAE